MTSLQTRTLILSLPISHVRNINVQTWLRGFQDKLLYTAVSRYVSYKRKRAKAYATMPNVIMGNGGFYGCLSEPQGVSAWWNETAQTRIRSLSFLVAESP